MQDIQIDRETTI